VVIGVGVEWVDVVRFGATERRFGARLRERLFTPGERAYAAERRTGVQSLAVRFAAKAAAGRALRAAGGAAPGWCVVVVVGAAGRAPALRFHGAAAETAARLGVRRVALTLTHDAACCIGQVVLES
jgi:holo-[acyl-carrier protein] synthase